jgi:hypothetical protein
MIGNLNNKKENLVFKLFSINDSAHKNNDGDKTKKFNIDTIKLMVYY